MSKLSIDHVVAAQQRIKPYVIKTPLLQSQLLNEWLGHEIIFKAECFQKTGAFKIRGAANILSWLKETGQQPKRIIANSSGNHAQGVSFASKLFNLPATIYSATNISGVKAAATSFYGADLKLFETRKEADEQVAIAAEEEGTYWIPPFNHEQIVSGQGTAALEALQEIGEVDGVCAPCGGGGLLSGTLIATRATSPKAEVFGAEPLAGNDAAESIRQGSIQRLSESPKTLADGAATLAVGDITFPFLQQLDSFYEVDEPQIAYWTQWLQHLLKIHVEPTSAMTMGAVAEWLKGKRTKQRVLVILSGGNIDYLKMQALWQDNHLENIPSL
ncbi:serine/threonine dehydratase [Alteromonadaceae bacterium M269]|nr:serine/threonine dehydratase [Alteromonadaceae bacterium M269]